MKNAEFYREMTGNKSLLYTVKYEKDHPILMNKIESAIMEAVEDSQYIATLNMHMLSNYDVKMITKVLAHYGFYCDWSTGIVVDECYELIQLTIHWS